MLTRAYPVMLMIKTIRDEFCCEVVLVGVFDAACRGGYPCFVDASESVGSDTLRLDANVHGSRTIRLDRFLIPRKDRVNEHNFART